jgi:hypothetical protein
MPEDVRGEGGEGDTGDMDIMRTMYMLRDVQAVLAMWHACRDPTTSKALADGHDENAEGFKYDDQDDWDNVDSDIDPDDVRSWQQFCRRREFLLQIEMPRRRRNKGGIVWFMVEQRLLPREGCLHA